MTSNSIWIPTQQTRIATTDFVLSRGGPKAATLPEHSHPELQVSVRFRPTGAKSGDPVEMTLHAPQQSHASGWGQGWQVVVWHLSNDLVQRAAEELGGRGRIEVIPVACGRDPLLEAMARTLLRDFPSAIHHDSLYFGSMATFLAGHIVRAHCDLRVCAASSHRLTATQMRRLQGFVHERMETGFDVAELVSWMGIPALEFAERLRLTTGLAPWAYVQQYRISMACRLLKNQGLSLADVAHRLGFANQSHFTNAFRARMRTTPGAYRKRR